MTFYDSFTSEYKIGEYIVFRLFKNGELFIGKITGFRKISDNEDLLIALEDCPLTRLIWTDYPFYIKKVTISE